MRRFVSVLTVLLASAAATGAQEVQIANLGECALESGEVLAPCDIGYVTWGELNDARDNAILLPTWYTGRSVHNRGYVESGMFDETQFYIISVDALGNGVSTSPSNSLTQGSEAFPEISIGDMVESQYRLVTEVLGLDGLYAVGGGSMGGMQTFEWAVAHPGFFEKAVPLIGSPRLGAYDIAVWEARIRILEWIEECACNEAAEAYFAVGRLTNGSPDYQQRLIQPDSFHVQMARSAGSTLAREGGWKRDQIVQARAMINHDVSRHFGGDMEAAAAAVTAQLLSVVVATDHVVTPGPAIELVEMIGGNARSIVLDNDCGHGGLGCSPYIDDVKAFLKRN